VKNDQTCPLRTHDTASTSSSDYRGTVRIGVCFGRRGWWVGWRIHIDSIDGGHEASYGARSRARERASPIVGSALFNIVSTRSPNV
jgi:hypothetical protein